jgi:DNA-binding LacI/PurR family transcriptional regulator
LGNRLRNRLRDEDDGRAKGRRRVQLADVARRAQVSASTASRALNGRGELSPATRAAVLRAADELGFRPSPFARSLRTQRSSIVGLVVPDVAHPFYAAVLKGAQGVLEQERYALFLLDTRGDDDGADRALDTLLAHQAEGILIATPGVSAERMAEAEADARCVFVDEVVPGAGAGSVLVENRAGMRMLVDHLVEHGHRRIGLLAGPGDTSGAERREGYHDALAAHGLRAPRGAVRDCAWTTAAGYHEGLKLLALRSRPTAVIASSAELSLGFLAAARSRGVAIPADVALAAFDDPYFAALLEPALTTVGYDAAAIGAAAARMLVQAIGAPDRLEYRAERVGVRLIPRRSCGCDHDVEAYFREAPE